MDAVIDLVLETTRAAYPSLDVPFHSRWRHFVNAGDNRWADVADSTAWPDRAARGRAEFDLAITSVFLDAGAGPTWRYKDPKTGASIGRSEGLGLASLAMFADGAFSADASQPLRADASTLAKLDVSDLKLGMQASLKAAPTCCAGSACWSPPGPTCSAARTHRARAACSIDWPHWPIMAACPHR
jgi:hypothetical protein